MNKILYIILISLFSLTIISCNKKSSTSDDTTAPVIAEVTPVPNQISNSAPEYTFSSTKDGTIIYGSPSFDFPVSNLSLDQTYSVIHQCFLSFFWSGKTDFPTKKSGEIWDISVFQKKNVTKR